MQKYGAQLRIIHWLMFICFSVLFTVGYFMTEFKQAEPWSWYALHKSFGVLVLMLLLLRWFTRFTSQLPEPADYMQGTGEKVAKSVVHTLYLLMLLVPISGYLMSNLSGFSVEFFGLALPTVLAENTDIKDLSDDIHFYLAYIFLAVIGLHILSVIKHHVQGNNVLSRIT